jgi:hypothetical protein
MSRNPDERRAGGGRDLLAPAALLAAFLALVAVASRGRVGSGSSSDGGSPLLTGIFPYLYASLLLIGAFALPFFFYVATKQTPYSRRQRQRARLLPLWIAVIAVVAVAIRSRLGDSFSDVIGRIGISDRMFGGGSGQGPGGPPAPELVPLVVVSSVLAVGIGSVLARREWTRRRRRSRTVADALSATVEQTIEDLRSETDPRRAIIRAYARMERALEASGVPRHEAEAPLEYVARVLLELDVRPEPVHALTDLFERAKFSRQWIDVVDKERAIAALEDVRGDLESLP